MCTSSAGMRSSSDDMSGPLAILITVTLVVTDVNRACHSE
jgi:hypothetical protein